MNKTVNILHAEETIFFSTYKKNLCQWIKVTIESSQAGTEQGKIELTAGGKKTVTELNIKPGINEYRCYAPLLWPKHAPANNASVILKTKTQTVRSTVSVGMHRPWKAYLLSDVCTDYTWVYGSEKEMRYDDAALTDTEIELAEKTKNRPAAERNKYNFVHSRVIEFYLEHFPKKAGILFKRIKDGTLTLNPLYNMCLTGAMSLEELIRHLYYAGNFAKKYKLDIGYANHQETPNMTWIMPTLFSACGINHLVKGIYPYECPWISRLPEDRVLLWQGPDGERMLFNRYKTNYCEGMFAVRGLENTNSTLHGEKLPWYENQGRKYPFDAISLIGTYNDLSPDCRKMAVKKAEVISAYNSQGWEYPKLINASHKQYWDDIEQQLFRRKIKLPVYRGDFGSSWEAWPSCLAHDSAMWRRAQEKSGACDRLFSILSSVDKEWFESRKGKLAEGWRNLIYLADHAWNGANDLNKQLNASLRRAWQTASNSIFDELLSEGLKVLASRIPSGKGAHFAVFNPLGWKRTGIVELPEGASGNLFCDGLTKEALPCQAIEEGGKKKTYIEARGVPPFGYRVVSKGKGSGNPAKWKWKTGRYRLESSFYSLEIDPKTGGIASLYDKTRKMELSDLKSPYCLNEGLYFSDGIEYEPSLVSTEIRNCGPLLGQIISKILLKDFNITSTITLYTGIDRVDIRNEVTKKPSSDEYELDFVFPFNVPERHYRCEIPGAILDPENNMLEGSGQNVTAVRHFVDIFNNRSGVLLSQADSHLIEFGHRTTQEDPLSPDMSNATVFALAMQNTLDKREAIINQGDISKFVFRYSIKGHAGSFDPVEAVHFGWEDNNELLSVALKENTSGSLPADVYSILEVNPASVIPVTLKPAEERGLILRLWECSGKGSNAAVSVSGGLKKAVKTDLLERDMKKLNISKNRTNIAVNKNGLCAVRLIIS